MVFDLKVVKWEIKLVQMFEYDQVVHQKYCSNYLTQKLKKSTFIEGSAMSFIDPKIPIQKSWMFNFKVNLLYARNPFFQFFFWKKGCDLSCMFPKLPSFTLYKIIKLFFPKKEKKSLIESQGKLYVFLNSFWWKKLIKNIRKWLMSLRAFSKNLFVLN